MQYNQIHVPNFSFQHDLATVVAIATMYITILEHKRNYNKFEELENASETLWKDSKNSVNNSLNIQRLL